MSAISFSADGDYVFLALENASGNQLVARASRDDLSTWQAVYSPGDGSACNIQPCVANPDVMFFYGNFGTDITVIKHTISTITNEDISPASLGANVVNTLQSNPANEDELIITIDTDQDLEYSGDGGATWDNYENALGFDATALWVLWSGKYAPNRMFVAGNNGTDIDYLYSPNDMISTDNRESAGLAALADITNIEALE